MIYSSYK